MGMTLNWIHFTDIHFGMEGQEWLWPKLKLDFLKDIRKLTETIGAWDVVFFTGDFTQRGQREEFDAVAKELETIWKTFSNSGQAPVLCTVPGNHDMVRPAPAGAAAAALRHWWDDEEIRREFWSNRSSECRRCVDSAFSNYSEWVNRLQIPHLPCIRGSIPGDFSSVLKKGDAKVGIVGLNTAFLQVGSGDFKGQLDLHVSQLNDICNGDPAGWANLNTFNLILTHHPSEWLAPAAQQHFRGEVYPAGRFYSQLCGHLHESSSYELAEGGGIPRRFRQGPSLFGLEKWAGATPQVRSHGYIAGQFVLNGSKSSERVWPRTALASKQGGLRICPDQSYELTDDGCFENRFELEEFEDQGKLEAKGSKETVDLGRSGTFRIAQTPALSPLEPAPDVGEARKRLETCPRLRLVPQPHHRLIRQEEQSLFEHGLRKSRCVWLVADWGTGKEGFLAVGFARFADQEEVEIFHLKCDESSDSEALLALFPQQFGMPLQALCPYLLSTKSAFLILDGLHPDLCGEQQLTNVLRILSAVLDYCPELRIVPISRIPPATRAYETVELRPLEGPDVRTYITHHPDASPELREPDIIEKLQERSDGLPMHLDRMIRALKVSSLDSVLEGELAGQTSSQHATEEVPKALVHAVAAIAKSDDRRTKRSVRLLKVLSVLPYGETIESMGHFLPTEPFYIENALQLHDLALLDVATLQALPPRITVDGTVPIELRIPKILRVPRQVRDYVQLLISESERDEIVSAGAEQFFGRKWREGKIKLRDLPVEYRDYVSGGPGNEFAIIHHLLQRAKDLGDGSKTRRAARLGAWYCEHLANRDRYRDVAIVASALLQQLDGISVPDQWSSIAASYGESLRMIDRDSEALTYLQQALEAGGGSLSPSRRAAIHVSVAMAHMTLGNKEEAIRAAEETKRITGKEDGSYFMAEHVLAELTLDGVEKTNRLRELEAETRKKRFLAVANNIALDLAYESEKDEEEAGLLDRVLESDRGGYTNARAILAKAKASLRSESTIHLSARNLNELGKAYSYTHTQRLGEMFNSSHEALWHVLEARADVPQMLRLFRHSSFVWRIRGDDKTESEYLRLLSDRKPPEESVNPTSGVLLEVKYFWRRVRVVLVGQSAGG
jgi:hypothetical protein